MILNVAFLSQTLDGETNINKETLVSTLGCLDG